MNHTEFTANMINMNNALILVQKRLDIELEDNNGEDNYILSAHHMDIRRITEKGSASLQEFVTKMSTVFAEHDSMIQRLVDSDDIRKDDEGNWYWVSSGEDVSDGY